MSSARALNLSISLVNIRRQGRSHKKKPGDATGSYDPYFMWKQDSTGKKVYILL
ncbi:hypothetical protein L917_19372 [Phytophthora nicotianae]|uniref:Uncharacterized protein n=1 Tax=Phytophthora nicotianae TaxID=4792 RepID=W2K6D9_PHYNI|nr:hypothetical protein L917_19372 [Phytophthora nicotianae]